MRIKNILPFLFLIFSIKTFAQVEVSAGMGLSYFFDADLRDYVNEFTSSNSMKTFNSQVEFFGEIDLPIKGVFEWGIEYAYSIYSFHENFGYSLYDLILNNHKPSVVFYYVIKGKGYRFKFGGGMGVRILQFKERLPYLSSYKVNNLVGWGALLKSAAITSLGNNLFALIAVNLRLDEPGSHEIEQAKLFNNTSFNSGKINLSSFSFGLLVGITYQF